MDSPVTKSFEIEVSKLGALKNSKDMVQSNLLGERFLCSSETPPLKDSAEGSSLTSKGKGKGRW